MEPLQRGTFTVQVVNEMKDCGQLELQFTPKPYVGIAALGFPLPCYVDPVIPAADYHFEFLLAGDKVDPAETEAILGLGTRARNRLLFRAAPEPLRLQWRETEDIPSVAAKPEHLAQVAETFAFLACGRLIIGMDWADIAPPLSSSKQAVSHFVSGANVDDAADELLGFLLAARTSGYDGGWLLFQLMTWQDADEIDPADLDEFFCDLLEPGDERPVALSAAPGASVSGFTMTALRSIAAKASAAADS